MSVFKEIMSFRFACKKFDTQKKIPQREFDEILDAIVMSPSSFGMEPWRIIVAESTLLREQIRLLGWNQPQITDASHLLIFTTDNASIKAGTQYVKDMFERREISEEATKRYLEVYKNYTESMSEEEFTQWSQKQCYIAAANAMSCAASLKIDSCPIEGFDKKELHKLLALEDSKGIALMVALGFRDMVQTPQLRLGKDELIRYM